MSKFLVIMFFILVGGIIEAITVTYITDHVFFSCLPSAFWMGYLITYYNKRFIKREVV